MFNNIRSRKKDSSAGLQKPSPTQEGKAWQDHARSTNSLQRQPISEHDISESYIQLPTELPQSNAREEAKQLKPNKRRLPFLMRRKKAHGGISPSKAGVDDDYDDSEDVISYDDVTFEHRNHSIEHNSLNPVMLAELKNLKRANEGLKVDESYNGRVGYITKNYRHPPPYAGYSPQDNASNGAPSMMQQLLLEQRNVAVSKDNSSMLNYCPVEQSAGLSNEDLTRIMKLFPKDKNDPANSVAGTGLPGDRLVLSTQGRSRRSSANDAPSTIEQPSLPSLHYEQHDQYSNSRTDIDGVANNPYQSDNLSEVYPRDYDHYVPPPDYRDEFMEDDDLRRHYLQIDRTSPTSALSSHLESTHLGGQLQASYVPPSPYLNAEIPDWLQVYSKASIDLDEYLKWDMFRYPELDCWQTMLKRLYKKELEQIVLWFEEYRQALQKEIERRSMALGGGGQQRGFGGSNNALVSRMKKTEV